MLQRGLRGALFIAWTWCTAGPAATIAWLLAQLLHRPRLA